MRLQDWEIRKASNKLNLTPMERFVLMTLNSYGEDVHPAMNTVLDDTGLSKNGYYSIRKRLVDKGIISTDHQSTMRATDIHINYEYLKSTLESFESTIKSFESTSESSEGTSKSSQWEHKTKVNTKEKSKVKTKATAEAAAENLSTQESTGEQSDPWMDSLVASNQPGSNTKESRESSESTKTINPYADMTPEELEAHIEALEPDPIEHTGWLAHRGIK